MIQGGLGTGPPFPQRANYELGILTIVAFVSYDNVWAVNDACGIPFALAALCFAIRKCCAHGHIESDVQQYVALPTSLQIGSHP
eukprot:5086719-Pyramimonas_sp.AAC.1